MLIFKMSLKLTWGLFCPLFRREILARMKRFTLNKCGPCIRELCKLCSSCSGRQALQGRCPMQASGAENSKHPVTHSRNTTAVTKTHNSRSPRVSVKQVRRTLVWVVGWQTMFPAPLVLQIQPIAHATLVLCCSWSVTTVVSRGAAQPAEHQGHVTAIYRGISKCNLHVSLGGQKCNVLI